MTISSPWLAVYSAPSSEARLKKIWLEDAFGLRVVMPMITMRVRERLRGRALRWVEKTKPYFPRYVFTQLPYGLVERIRSLSCVSTIISAQYKDDEGVLCTRLIEVPERVVERLKALDGTVVEVRDRDKFSMGQPVKMAGESALAGFLGIVEHVWEDRDVAKVSIEIFGSVSSVMLPLADLRAVSRA